jgi:hypothetical protein
VVGADRTMFCASQQTVVEKLDGGGRDVRTSGTHRVEKEGTGVLCTEIGDAGRVKNVNTEGMI